MVGLVPRPTLFCAAALLLAHAGCAALPQAPLSIDRGQPLGGRAVGVDSDGLVLGEADGAALSPQRLLTEVADLLRQNRAASARRLVQRYPDVAWELLRGPVPAGAGTDVLRAVAAAHDAQCLPDAGAAGWTELLKHRDEHPEPYQQYAERREKFLAKVRQGLAGEALAAGLAPPEGGKASSLLAVDAMQLTAAALLRDNRPEEAADAYRRATVAARGAYPYYEALMRLQFSEALRHAGRISEADAAWLAAVDCASEGLRGDPGVFDPGFWQRAAYHRPVHQPWPASVARLLAELSGHYGVLAADATSAVLEGGAPPHEATATSRDGSATGTSQPADERFLWSCIGHWRLERGEPEAALVALKQAHTLATSPGDRQRLELAQAGALMALAQPTAATAVLIGLSESSDDQIARPALAMLGTLRLEAGNTKQGYTFLRRALEEGDPVDWPNRAGAEADLGLAYLMLGNEQAGLRWLRGAQARFDADGARDLLLRSLENELAYMEQTKKRSEAKALRQRIDQLEADGQPEQAAGWFGSRVFHRAAANHRRGGPAGAGSGAGQAGQRFH